MKRVKKILKQIFFLPPIFVIIISIPAFAAVIYVLLENISGPMAYMSYLASAYALITLVVGFPGIVRSIRRWIAHHPFTKKVLRTPLGHQYVENIKFRTEVSVGMGLAINLLYIIIKMVSGIYYRSIWFVVLAIYYTLLAVMRFLLIYRKNWPEGQARLVLELRRYRLCGIVLLMMNLALAGIVILMVWHNRGYNYPGALIYAMAAYSFYAVIVAAINIIKFRKYGSPILSAAMAINLVAALVSILSLQTAMLAQFGSEDDLLFRKTMTKATGGAICVIVLGMALFIIMKTSKQLKQIRI